MNQRHAGWQLAAAGLIALLGASGLQAQQVYRTVGPDGRVSFSDQPPPAGKGQAVSPGAGSSVAANGALPYELRQVASRFPVTLYSGENCGPCGSARAYLSNRGIPFTEKTVTTAEDGQALSRIAGSSSLPLVTVGSQQIKGYSDAEMTQFLDAAGYPKASKLPAGYRNPPASPLVEVQRSESKAKPAGADGEAPRATPRARRAAPEPVENTTNPAGIRF